MREIMEVIGISHGSVVMILNDHLGVAFAHNRPQTQSCDNFEGVFGVVQPQYG